MDDRKIFWNGVEYTLQFSSEERDVLHSVASQMRSMIAENDPDTYRLFPPAYMDDLRREFPRRQAACIQPADDRADARAGDVVDRDVHFFERLEHADMRHAARAAAAQHEADLRPMRGAPLRLCMDPWAGKKQREGENHGSGAAKYRG